MRTDTVQFPWHKQPFKPERKDFALRSWMKVLLSVVQEQPAPFLFSANNRQR
jgi:hypothetical protein